MTTATPRACLWHATGWSSMHEGPNRWQGAASHGGQQARSWPTPACRLGPWQQSGSEREQVHLTPRPTSYSAGCLVVVRFSSSTMQTPHRVHSVGSLLTSYICQSWSSHHCCVGRPLSAHCARGDHEAWWLRIACAGGWIGSAYVWRCVYSIVEKKLHSMCMVITACLFCNMQIKPVVSQMAAQQLCKQACRGTEVSGSPSHRA